MSVMNSSGDEATAHDSIERRRGSFIILCLRFALLFVFGCFLAGFAWFALHIADQRISDQRQADGIVVLTGGASRIEDGIQLLVNGHARRMLITGVHRSASAEEIARQAPYSAKLFSCCIDIDRNAMNTIGNAIETRRWRDKHGYQSLIVVTSAYHMPRTLLEFSRVMPQVTLIPHAVVSPRMQQNPWWASLETMRVLLAEYVKYLYAWIRGVMDNAL